MSNNIISTYLSKTDKQIEIIGNNKLICYNSQMHIK